MTGGERATAVVVVNYRTKELTARAVASVATEPEVAEIVVVDNASGDGSADYLGAVLTDPRVRVVESRGNAGFGAGVNLGVRSCTAPVLLVLNSDAALVAGSLGLLVGALLADESVGVVAPAVYGPDGRDLQPGAHGVFPTLATILRRTNTRPPETVSPDWVSGVAMAMRRSDFEAVDGFDPDFTMYLEDVDLCRRLRLAGKQVRRVLGAGVVHVGNQSWDSFTVALDLAHRSRVAYFRKAGLPAAQRLAVEVIRLGHLTLQRTPLRRSFPGRGEATTA